MNENNFKTPDGSECYQGFANYYDLFMAGSKKYAIWQQIIHDVVEKYQVPKGICLDIACGTGAISQIVADQGFRVIGIDRSEKMILEAQKKLPNANFITSDIRDFCLPNNQPGDFAVSFYDSLNYLLTDDDMVKMFKAVNRNLKKGSIFLFDMNTNEHVTVSQKNLPKVLDYDDLTIVLKFSGVGRIWILDFKFFVRQSDDSFKMFQEQHIERGYDAEDIKPLLEKAGFTLLEVRKENKVYEDGLEHLSRLYFIAQN